MSTKKQLLGDFTFAYDSFSNLDELFKQFHTPAYKSLSIRKKFKTINKALLDLIQNAKEPCFLLPATLEFIDRVNQEKLLHEPYRFTSFEFWLNRFSHLSEEDNLKVRAKIVGKWIPRADYQAFFPIGMGKVFSGTHFVAAHASPDIDTTIASFWGWIDAFGAKLAEGVHLWSLPGTFPECHFTFLFQKLFSPKVFEQLARTIPTLTLTALDLVTQDNITKVQGQSLASHVDHAHVGQALILVDDNEHYIGDWRASDAEAVGNIMILFNHIIRWFENTIHAKLIATFAKPSISLKDISKIIAPIFDQLIKDCDPAKEFNEKQKKQLNDYLSKVLHVKNGIHSSFLELGRAIDAVTSQKFSMFYTSLESLSATELYDKTEKLIEDRPTIFSRLEKIIHDLSAVIYDLRMHIERLTTLLEVKEKVLGNLLQFVTLKSDVDEIKSKMDGLEHITVVIPEENGKLYPVGVIHAHDLRRPVLGTVSLRDFSNEQETQMASYLEVISVIDHHKTQLKTLSAPCFLIADVQSSNTLVASLAFEINERYSLLGTTKSAIDKHISDLSQVVSTTPFDSHKLKKLSRLLQLKLNTANESGYFVHPGREYAEYLCYLYAILDDTDLLTKVSDRDVECVATLLNRMKSLSCGEDTEIISLEHIPKDEQFAKHAAALILQNSDMYSIYKKIYEFKEQEMEANLASCVASKPSTVFADTKEQNGCCRVGQTKIFNTNYPFFSEHAMELRTLWLKSAKKVFETKNHIDFHLHMISTVAGAKEVYSGQLGNWKHQDEMWFWVPPTELASERLVNFLIAFHPTEAVQENEMTVQFLGPNAQELDQIFEQNFPKAVRKPFGEKEPQGLPIAILRYKAGSINSRKAQISPYLPRFVP